MLILGISCLVVFVLFSLLIFFYVNNQHNIKRGQYIIEKFSLYTTSFEYLALKCFDIIYKDELLVYSVEGQKIRDDEFDAIIRKFVDLFFKYCGSTVLREFIFLYGDEQTLIFVLVEYFHTKYENDEIYGDTVNSIPNTNYPE